jgi:hypothetical protein
VRGHVLLTLLDQRVIIRVVSTFYARSLVTQQRARQARLSAYLYNLVFNMRDGIHEDQLTIVCQNSYSY